jgi:hypothetical protein
MSGKGIISAGPSDQHVRAFEGKVPWDRERVKLRAFPHRIRLPERVGSWIWSRGMACPKTENAIALAV